MNASAISQQASRSEEWRTTSSGEAIPRGWKLARLGEVAEHCLGKMLDKQKQLKGEPLPYLRNPNVKWFEFDLSRLETMRFQEHELERYELRSGDVIICEGGEPGRAAIWDGGPTEIKFQKALHRVRTSPILYNRFLVHRLRADATSGRLRWYFTGTTIKHFTGQDLDRYLFPLPPIGEQRRIAAILDKADAIRRKREEGIRLTEELLRSTFLDMFGDPATNPRHWPSQTIDDVASKVTDGEHATPQRSESGIMLLSARNIKNGFIDLDEKIDYITEPEFDRIRRRCQPTRGDVLISCSGTIGRVTSVQIDEPFALVRSVALVRPKIDKIHPRYLEFYLRSEAVQRLLHRSANKSSQANLFTGPLKVLPVLVPSLSNQGRFGDWIEAAGKVHAQRLETVRQSNELFASLVQRAFRGEL